MDETSVDSSDFVLPSLQKKVSVPSVNSGPDFVLPSQKNTPRSLTADVAMAPVSGLQQGIYSLPETIQGASNLIESIPGRLVSGGIWAGEKLRAFPSGISEQYEQSMENVRKEAAKRQNKYGYDNQFPSEKEVTKAAESIGIPTATPAQTPPGRVVEAGFKQLPASLIAGPGSALERGAIGVIGGMSGQATAEPFRGTKYEPWANLVGSLGGGFATAGASSLLRAKSPENIDKIANQLAGKAARESFVQPEAAERTLAAPTPDFVPKVEPTTAQTLQVKGAENAAKQAQALAQKVVGMKEFENTPEAAAYRNQMEVSQENLLAQSENAARRADAAAGKPIDISTSFGLYGTSPQGEASINVRNMIAALDTKLAENSSQAWKDAKLQSAGVYKNKAVGQLNDYLDNLTMAKKSAFPSEIQNILDKIGNMEGSQIPFTELQDLRSLTLAQARKAYASPNVVDAPALYGFANKIGDILSNPDNIRFGNSYGEIEAWNQARAATKQYYDTFGDGYLANMVNNDKVSSEMTIKNLYRGDAAPNNLRELRTIFGNQADNHVSDWLIGELTDNGKNINLTPDKVNSFMGDTKNAALINQIPGLSNRLMGIAQRAGESAEQSQARQFSDNFAKIVERNNPKLLFDFLNANPDMVKKVFSSPDQQQYIGALKNSADALSKIGNAKIVPSETLKNLQDNNMFTLLYGRATGALSDTVIGVLAGKALESAVNVTGAGPIGGVFGALGVLKRAVPAFFNKANDYVFGGTREDAIRKLQAAASDPQLMQALLNQPNPNGWSRLNNALMGSTAKAAIPATEEQERMGHKSGGRVGVLTPQALLSDLKRRKIKLANKTEHMLSLPDDAVVQALDAAKR